MTKELTPEDSETYLAIVKGGNMDEMFDWAFKLGEIEGLKKAQEIIKQPCPKN